MEIKPTGKGIEALYAKVKIPDFLGKSTRKNFLEELSDRLGPALAAAAPVKPDFMNGAALRPESVTGPAAADPAAAGAETAVQEKAPSARVGAVAGAAVKSVTSENESGDAPPAKTVPQSVLLVKNEPVTIEPARSSPAKGENVRTETLKIESVNVALLKGELLRGGAVKSEPAESVKTEPALTHPVEYVVKEGDSLWKIGRQLFKTDPYRIARDNGITNPNLIRPGQKLIINPPPPQAEPPRLAGEVTASWYGGNHHNKVTASGERFDMHKDTLAHKTLPLGTKVRLVNPDNGRFAEGVVTDRGPYIKGRDVDLSYAMAQKLGFVKKGVTKLDIETI